MPAYSVTPKIRFYLASEGVAYRTVFGGYGSHDVLSDSPTWAEEGNNGCIVYKTWLDEMGLDEAGPDVPGARYEDGRWSVLSLLALRGDPSGAAPIICTPMHDVRRRGDGSLLQIIGADIPEVPASSRHFKVTGDGPGYRSSAWSFGIEPGEDDDSGGFMPVIRYNRAIRTPHNEWSAIVSRFTMPAYPVLSIGLHRAVPFPKAEKEREKLGPCKMFIKFGVTAVSEYNLEIPYAPDYPMRLWWKHSTLTGGKYVPLYTNSTTAFPASTDAGGKHKVPDRPEYVWIVPSYRGIAVSTNALENSVFFHYPEQVATYSNPFHTQAAVPEGKVIIGSNGGMWGASFVPVIMPHEGWYQTPVKRLPYPHSLNPLPHIPGAYYMPVRDWDQQAGQWVLAETYPGSGVAATVRIEDITGKPELVISGKRVRVRVPNPDAFQSEYLVRLKSSHTIHKTPDGLAQIEVWRSPQCYEVRPSKESVVDDRTAIINRTFTDIEADNLDYSYDNDSLSGVGSVTVDNNPDASAPEGWGEFINNWKPRRCVVFGTWATKT